METEAPVPSTPSPTPPAAEPSASPNLNEALDTAWGEATAETTPEPERKEPVKETSPKEEPAEEPPLADEPEDEVLSLSPEELAAIKADPKLAILYKRLWKGVSGKWQSMAAQRKLLERLEKDPLGVIRENADRLGIEIKEKPKTAASTVVSEAYQKAEAVFGKEAAEALRGIFAEIAQGVVEREVVPLRQHTQDQQIKELAKETEGTVESFKKELGPKFTPAVEKEMLRISKVIQPAKDENGIPTTSQADYLRMLHRLATHDQAKTEATVEVTERIRQAASEGEPRRGIAGSSAPIASKVKREMGIGAALDAAWEEARTELGR